MSVLAGLAAFAPFYEGKQPDEDAWLSNGTPPHTRAWIDERDVE